MLYSLLISTIALAMAIPTLCLLSFRWGFRYGNDGKTASEKKMSPKIFTKPRKESKEMKRNREILENIENYCGDGSNQKKI